MLFQISYKIQAIVFGYQPVYRYKEGIRRKPRKKKREKELFFGGNVCCHKMNSWHETGGSGCWM
jgi:hypothetical protein